MDVSPERGVIVSSGNFQFERKRNFELQKKRVDSNYTIKTGTATYNGIMDNPVAIYDPAADIAITLPNGSYIGQEVLIVVESNDETKDATVTVSSSANASEDSIILEDVGEYVKLLWNGAEWDVIAYEGCSMS